RGNEMVHDMRPDEARAPRNSNPHGGTEIHQDRYGNDENKVELRGFEPLCPGFSAGLLRAQPAISLGQALAAGTGACPSQAKDVPSQLARHRCGGKPCWMTPVTDPQGRGRTDVATY